MPRPGRRRGSPSAHRYLASRTRLGVKFGLDTIRAVLARMGHPESAFPSLLVAGTNGKGSVVAYTDAALRASGLRVGRYTSPHLARVNERIAVDGRDITDAALEAAVLRVRAAAEGLVREGTIAAHPTYFEALTAAAFAHFRDRAVDVAVLEVGMGGRLDATNVVDPLASAIVSVDLDHEAYLGTSRAAIAREKAGVLRRDRTTVLGSLDGEARQAVVECGRAVGARLLDARAGCAIRHGESGWDLRTPRGAYRGLRPLPGAHQVDNVRVAIRLLEEAGAAGLPFDAERVAGAIRGARWPGRLESIRGDIGGMAGALFPAARAVVLTRPRVERAATPAQIAERAGRLADGARREDAPRRALAWARRQARPDATVVVAGSLFLVGELRAAAAAGSARSGQRAAASRPRK